LRRGEVVERPASVIKELVENSIDAGARRVAIAIELGGKKLIQVEDDGEGMEPGDARLAVERHATSKIRRSEDLEGIATLGFRGEALPSIASVSHFVLRSRARGAASGTAIRINGGAVAAVAEVGMAEGTSIEVGDLFYNLPARRKFLKSDGAESAQVSRIVTQLALCYPEIGFTLTSAGRRVIQCPPVASLRDRLYQLYGERTDLVEVRRDTGDVKVLGYVAALAEHGPTRGPQNVFVNRRIVKDRTIAHAIIDSYSVASIKERSPEVHLFITMPPAQVDVNVHPTKAEVRFRDQSHIHEVIRRTLGDALGRGPVPELRLEAQSPYDRPATTLPLPTTYAGTFPSRWISGPPKGGHYDPSLVTQEPGVVSGVSRTEDAATPTIRPMIALGQFRDTFIIAVDEEGIAIIDQHVAHERVLFERIMERLGSGRLESQQLLEPMLIELPAAARQALSAHTAELERLGFGVEEFGGDAIRVMSVPALLRREECDAAFERWPRISKGSIAAHAWRARSSASRATMACHAAVKANYPLTAEKMAHIPRELRRTAYSTICPHGRPVMLRLTRREVEKNFRI
jgi:DNA mismatch repair protein MutL